MRVPPLQPRSVLSALRPMLGAAGPGPAAGVGGRLTFAPSSARLRARGHSPPAPGRSQADRHLPGKRDTPPPPPTPRPVLNMRPCWRRDGEAAGGCGGKDALDPKINKQNKIKNQINSSRRQQGSALLDTGLQSPRTRDAHASGPLPGKAGAARGAAGPVPSGGPPPVIMQVAPARPLLCSLFSPQGAARQPPGLRRGRGAAAPPGRVGGSPEGGGCGRE